MPRRGQPLRDRTRRTRAPAAYEAADGSKPGIVRWNSSWWRTTSSDENCTSRCANSARATRASGLSSRSATTVEELPVAFGEHGVVEVVLRLEVRVQRRLAELDHVGEVAQRDPGETRRGAPASTPRRGSAPASRHDAGPAGRPAPCAPGSSDRGAIGCSACSTLRSITDRFSIADRNTKRAPVSSRFSARMPHSPGERSRRP